VSVEPATVDSTVPSFSSTASTMLVPPAVLRIVAPARLWTDGLPLRKMPRSAVASTIVPAFSSRRVSHRFTLLVCWVTTAPASTRVRPESVM
jgi:hypothetical protein